MNGTRPLYVLLPLTLLVTLACGPKPRVDEPQPPVQQEPAEPEPATPRAVPDRIAPEPPEAPSAMELERLAGEFNRQGALKTIFFETDEAELLPEARRTLAANADWMRAHPDFAVLVAGHCDERNTAEYNLALGERRAEAVRVYLRSLGVSETRIETVSYGEERPLDAAHGEAAWARNRRAEFEVSPLADDGNS